MYENSSNNPLIKVEYNEDIRDSLVDIFSCLIPNSLEEDIFNSDAAYKYFGELDKIIMLDELQGDMWLIFYAMKRLAELKIFQSDFRFLLDGRSFKKSLNANVTELMINNKDAFIPFLVQNGVDADFDIQKNVKDASNFLYTITLETFDSVSNNQLDVNDSLKYIDILRDKLMTLLAKKSLIIGADILSGEKVRFNRRSYSGVNDFIYYIGNVRSLISARFIDYLSTNRNSVSVTNLKSLKEFKQDNSVKIEKLFNMGWKPLDSTFSICTGDLVTLVGDEGVGKTNTAVRFAVRNIIEGHDTLMMTGESSIQKILNMCLSNYIYNKSGYQFTWKEVIDYDDETEEDQRLIDVWSADFVENPNVGKLHLERNFNYEDFSESIRKYKMKYPNISLVIIDHTDRLGSTGAITEDGYLREKKQKVDYLYKKEIELKQDLNLTFINLAHTSSDTQKAGVKGKDTGVRIGATSSATTKDADFVFLMSKDNSLSDNFIKWSCKKIRDYKDNIRPFVLEKLFTVSELIYDEEHQIGLIEEEGIDIDDLYGDG